MSSGIRPPLDLQAGIRSCSGVTDVSSADLQRAGLPPLTFPRQVLAGCLHPELLQGNALPPDVKQKAQTLLAACKGGSVGSYPATPSGFPEVLNSVAEFIRRRDGGVRSHPADIFCTTGSQKALQLVLHLLSSGGVGTQTGVLTPAPCPHTLPALLEETGVRAVAYRLDEERGWAVDLGELRRALRACRGRCQPRAVYVSNPGNPTGHVQDRDTMEEMIRFAADERLVLLAEEVYQDSVHDPDRDFLSYKKVLSEMDAKYSQTVEMISFHSISSVCMGEGGLRAGYMETTNLDPEVKLCFRKLQGLSSTVVLGQLALEVMVNPPGPGDPSWAKHTQPNSALKWRVRETSSLGMLIKDHKEILHRKETLSQNARRACDFLNGLAGMSCRPAMAGVFLYPRLLPPPRLLEEAQASGVPADLLYCRRLLEDQGVRLGPGGENGQQGGGVHVRLCVLAPAAALDDVLARIGSFHRRLMDGQ